MNREEFRFLWKYSALPILLVVTGLVGIGIYLQLLAVDIQTRPIHTIISPGTNGHTIEEDLVFEQADFVEFDQVGDERLSEASRLMQEGNDEAGIRILSEYINARPELVEDPRVMLALAQAYIRTGENQLAKSTLTEVPEGTGYDARIFFNLALVNQRTGNIDEALSSYRKALHLRPTYFEAAYNLGGLLLQVGRFDEAILVLTVAYPLAGGERKARALYNLGLALARSERNTEATEAYESAIKFDPTHLPSRVALAGLQLQNLDNPDIAEDLYREVLDLDSSHGPAYVGLARIEQERGNQDLAEEFLRSSISMDPTYDRARRVLASLLSETNRIEEARRELIWIRDNGVDRGEAAYQLGRIEYKAGNYNESISYYREALELTDDSHPQSLNNLGLALKAAGKMDEARSAFRNALNLDPEYANAHYNLGLLELVDDRLSEAETSFLDAVGINPDFVAAWHNLGLVWSATGQNANAIDAYEESLRIQPSNVKDRLNLAVLYRREGYPARALEQYNLVLALNPAYASAWFNLAVLQKSEGNFKGAEESYLRAIDLEPENEIYWKNLSVLYGSLNRIDDAVAILNEALEIHQGSGPLRYLLALQFKKRNDDYRALEVLERTVAVAPDYVKGWIALGDTQSDLKNHIAAIESYKRAEILNPDDSETLYQLGKEYFLLDDYSSAIGYFEEALITIRDNAWIWYNLGKAYQALNKNNLAEDAYKASISIDSSMGRFIYQRLDRVEDSIQVRRDMVERNPADISLKVGLAYQLRRAGYVDEALVILIEASKLDPENEDVWISMGSIYVELNNLEAADQSYKNAYKADSSNVDVAYEYGRYLVRDSRPDQAVLILESALIQNPRSFDVLRLFGDALYDLREYPRAIEAYRRAKEIDNVHGLNIIDLGKAYYRNKEYKNAMEEFQIGLDLLPDYDWAYIWLGRSMNKLGNYVEAENAYQGAREIDPGFIQSYIGLGDLAKSQDDLSRALEYYRMALNIDPSHTSTRKKVERLESTL